MTDHDCPHCGQSLLLGPDTEAELELCRKLAAAVRSIQKGCPHGSPSCEECRLNVAREMNECLAALDRFEEKP